jgi:hypothetical protein
LSKARFAISRGWCLCQSLKQYPPGCVAFGFTIPTRLKSARPLRPIRPNRPAFPLSASLVRLSLQTMGRHAFSIPGSLTVIPYVPSTAAAPLRGSNSAFRHGPIEFGTQGIRSDARPHDRRGLPSDRNAAGGGMVRFHVSLFGKSRNSLRNHNLNL